MRRNYFLILLVAISFLSCRTSYQPQSLAYQQYRINNELKKDSKLTALLQPFSDSVNSVMNEVVAYVEKDLNKTQPECELGNWMTDAYMTMARMRYKEPIDISMMNYGGVRLTQLAKGDVTRSKIFELMPFENELVVQKLTGVQLQYLMDTTAAAGGWPVSGVTFTIKNRKAVDIKVNGKTLDPNATYTVLNSDYIAKGGDNVTILKNIPYIQIGYLMRDALFDYIDWLKKQGKNITANIENRVVNAH